MNKERVVITGLGVIAPNGIGKDVFKDAITNGISGICFNQQLRDYNFGCQVAGIPKISEIETQDFLKQYRLSNKTISSGIIYGCISGIEAWKDSGLPIDTREPRWADGCIFGSGISGIEAIIYGEKILSQGSPKKMGGRIAQQAMNSGVSAYLGGILGLGNQVSTNASACTTGTEAIVMGYDRIRLGLADRMLVGSTDSHGYMVWAPFDAMFALTRQNNNRPKEASCPMSPNASGFVPGAGSGALVLERMDLAIARGATIYGEIIGANINSGGQLGNGTITIGNKKGIQKCIQSAIDSAQITSDEIDLISGHLTSTIGDQIEIECWANVLQRSPKDFPWINSLKSMIGHCLSGAGSIESVAAVLQMYHGFIHPSLNCKELHPNIASRIHNSRVPKSTINDDAINIVAKTSFGFGDVNACIIFQKFEN